MPALDSARRLLTVLVDRHRHDGGSHHPEPGYTPLIHVIGDVGRVIAEDHQGSDDDLRALLPAIAALREAFEREHYTPSIAATPWEALQQGEKMVPYAAGSLWACSAIIEARLDRRTLHHDRVAERISRADVRELVLDLLEKQGRLRPADVVEELEIRHGSTVDRTQISKAIGDLISTGQLEPTEAPEDGDRRARYYAAPDHVSALPKRVHGVLSSAAREALAHIPPDRAIDLFAEVIHEQDPLTSSKAM